MWTIITRLIDLTITGLKNHLLECWAFSLGLFWHFYITFTGLALTPDSAYFLNGALRFHYSWNFYLDPVRAPLYPFLVNIGMLFKRTPAEAAALVSGIVMISVIVVFALVIKRFSDDWVLNGLSLLLLFVFLPFSSVFGFAWTEGAFALFLLLAFYFLLRHYDGERLKDYIFAALFVSLASLTRYIGYAAIAAFILYTLYWLRTKRCEKKVSIVKYLAWNSLSYIPVLLYVFNNYLVSKTFHGVRPHSTRSVYLNIHLVLKVIGQNLGFYILFLLVIAIVFYIFLAKEKEGLEKKRYMFPLTFILFFAAIYIVMIVYTASTVRVNTISTRYFTPVYPFFFLFIVFAFRSSTVLFNRDDQDSGSVRGERIPGKLAYLLLYGFLIAALLGHAAKFTKHLNGSFRTKLITPKNAFAAGYNMSKVPVRFRSFIKEAFKENDTIYISAVYETPLKKNKAYNANVPFLREGSIDIPELGEYSFQKVQPASYRKPSRGFTIIYHSGKSTKRLIYKSLPIMKPGKRLLLRLVDIMKKEGIDSIFLIVNNDFKKIDFGKSLSKHLPQDLTIKNQSHIAHYFVFQIALKK